MVVVVVVVCGRCWLLLFVGIAAVGVVGIAAVGVVGVVLVLVGDAVVVCCCRVLLPLPTVW